MEMSTPSLPSDGLWGITVVLRWWDQADRESRVLSHPSLVRFRWIFPRTSSLCGFPSRLRLTRSSRSQARLPDTSSDTSQGGPSRERFSEAEQQVLERGVAEVHRRAGGRATREYHVGLPVWLANAEFARQVQGAGDEFETRASGADAVEHLKEMVSLFESHNLFPVFVVRRFRYLAQDPRTGSLRRRYRFLHEERSHDVQRGGRWAGPSGPH